MPSLGADMQAGRLVQWLKAPGDRLARGDIIAEVDTDKGAIEIEVFTDGVLSKMLVRAGQRVPVGTPLALIGREGGRRSDAGAGSRRCRVSGEAPPAQRVSGSRRWPGGSPTERGLDLGEGDGHRAGRRDHAWRTWRRPRPARPEDPATRMRQAIAAAMARSKREIPHYYLYHGHRSRPRDRVARGAQPRPSAGRAAAARRCSSSRRSRSRCGSSPTSTPGGWTARRCRKPGIHVGDGDLPARRRADRAGDPRHRPPSASTS